MLAASATQTAIIACAAIPVIWAAVSDLRQFKIPNECSLMLLVLFALFVATAPGPVDLGGPLLIAGLVFAVTFALYWTGRLGGGDVKLLSVLALWAGPAFAWELVLVTTLTGAVMSVLLMSPARFALAMALETAGERHAAVNVLAERMPYGIAIACGGITVFLKLLG